MSVLSLVFKELRLRWLNFALGLFAVAATVMLFAAILTLESASENETRRLMRDLGFNLVILPKATQMEQFWADDFAAAEMDESCVTRLAEADNLQAEHYVATLVRRIDWNGQPVFLKGVAKELGKKRKEELEKKPMGFSPAAGSKHAMIPPGKAYVGFELWNGRGLEVGDTIDVLGKKLEIIHCLFESGSKDDATIYANLGDVQEMLKLPGKINMIQALGCLCPGGTLEGIRAEMAKVVPEAKVTELTVLARARSQTREMVDRYGDLVLTIVLLVGALWVAVLSFLNVREREQEIGTLRALGLRTGQIASLFLVRAVLTGVVGALIGYAAGTLLALHVGPGVFKITHAKIAPPDGLLLWSLIAAPLIAAVASFIPTTLAVTQDPAVTLVKE